MYESLKSVQSWYQSISDKQSCLASKFNGCSDPRSNPSFSFHNHWSAIGRAHFVWKYDPLWPQMPAYKVNYWQCHIGLTVCFFYRNTKAKVKQWCWNKLIFLRMWHDSFTYRTSDWEGLSTPTFHSVAAHFSILFLPQSFRAVFTSVGCSRLACWDEMVATSLECNNSELSLEPCMLLLLQFAHNVTWNSAKVKRERCRWIWQL